METQQDRILVLEFLHDTIRGGMDVETWAKLNPEKFGRIYEIFLKKAENP